MTLAQLRTRCDYWTGRLNLKEWRITVQWATAKEARKLQGCCLWHAEELRATVEISKKFPDHEETLVHELLHIVIQGHEELKGGYDVNLERAINRLAAALMAGKGL